MWQNCLATKPKSLCRTNLHVGGKYQVSISQQRRSFGAYWPAGVCVCSWVEIVPIPIPLQNTNTNTQLTCWRLCLFLSGDCTNTNTFTKYQYQYQYPTDLLGSVWAPEGRLTRTESWSDRRVPWTLSWEISWFKTWMWEMRDVWWREMYKMWHEVCPEHWGTLSWEFLD